jgi:hypothetical protein
MAEVVEFGGDLLGRARPNVLASESKISNSFKRCFANCLFVNEPLPLTASRFFTFPSFTPSARRAAKAVFVPPLIFSRRVR